MTWGPERWGPDRYPPPPRLGRTLLGWLAALELVVVALCGPQTPQAHRLAYAAGVEVAQTPPGADAEAGGDRGGGGAPRLAGNPRITTTRAHGCDPARDLRAGRLDARAARLLDAIAKRWLVRVSCVRSGHSRYVKGTDRTSNHTVWRAFDLDMVGGREVGAGNADAKALARWAGDRRRDPNRPSEVGSPWRWHGGPWFTDAGHQSHVHIGWRAG